jgi:NAD+ diphosphatase
MIQDIGPHRFDRTYRTDVAEERDIVFCCGRDGVLLRRAAEGYCLPRFEEFPAALRPDRRHARHLFALDGAGCYLAEAAPAAGDLPEGWGYATIQDLRTVWPMEVAFAAVTALQLYRWYSMRRFCGRCGEGLQPGKTERSMVCPRCGLTEYPKICPAVIVAVTAGDRLLLTRYAGRPFRGWALIAGFAEIGETLEDTVRREVMEEVGLHVKNIRYYKSQPWAFTDTLLCGFYCELDGTAAITLDHNELSEGVWLTREEIPPRENDISLTAEMMERFRLGKERETVIS